MAKMITKVVDCCTDCPYYRGTKEIGCVQICSALERDISEQGAGVYPECPFPDWSA